MRKVLSFIFCISLFSPVFLLAQDNTDEKSEKGVEAKSDEVKKKRKYKLDPTISAGAGMTRYFGDIEDVNETTVHRIGNRFAFDVGASVNISRSFDASLNGIFGEISGNENSHRQHRNFEADFFSLGAEVTYNFRGLYKRDRPLTPFIGAGVYYSDYDTRTDLFDEDGNRYYYWDDGLIRNVPEGSNTDNIEFLERDYKYETHLNEFPVVTVAFPVKGGANLHISNRVDFRVSAAYFFTLSDKIDQFDNPKYSEYNDGYFYSSIGLRFHVIGPEEEEPKPGDPEFYFADFTAVEQADSDLDGVKDFLDKCAQTPSAVKVDEFGCPVDKDKDYIPDYLDKELDTKRNRVVDEHGVAINFMELAKQRPTDTIALLRSQVTEGFVRNQPGELKYTVHVGTYTHNIPNSLAAKLRSINGLRTTKVNDSTTVYTYGSFESFEQAEQKQNEFIDKGLDEAFGVSQNVNMEELATEVENLAKNSKSKMFYDTRTAKTNIPEDQEVVRFKVQVTEYRLRLDLDKLSTIMAREGVQMRTTTGGLKIYTIGSYETLEDAKALKKEIMQHGIKDAEIVATHNNESIPVEKALELKKEMKE